MTALVLDASLTRVRLHTFAEGLFARLAHDLELVARDVTGTADADMATASLVVPIGKIDVAGTLSGGKVDTGGLSRADRDDCLRKMRRDVFHATPDEALRIEARVYDPQDRRRARVRILPPHGRPVEQSVAIEVEVERSGITRVSGRFEVSLDAIGSSAVKGPMNAFRVKDGVVVLFDLVFTRAAEA